MLSILVLAIIVVLIAALLLYQTEKVFIKKSDELDLKLQVQTSTNNDLEKAHLRFQQLSNKLDGELEFWKKRRTMLPKVLKNTRKEKIRGKRRKGRK
jgi:hypothetical protein